MTEFTEQEQNNLQVFIKEKTVNSIFLKHDEFKGYDLGVSMFNQILDCFKGQINTVENLVIYLKQVKGSLSTQIPKIQGSKTMVKGAETFFNDVIEYLNQRIKNINYANDKIEVYYVTGDK
jgi:hypothetical protein